MEAREPDETQGGFRASVTLLRRNRNFRRLYLASVISLGGDWFLLIALFGLMLDLTGQAIAVAFTIAAQDLTYFAASPFAGVLADRLDRRRLMIACDLARAVLVLGFLLVRTEDLAWLVYVLLAGTAVFAAAFEPASMAAMPNLVDERDLSVANALSGSLWGTMLAVGGALGGVVAGVFGSDVAIVVDSASFVLSALLILGIHATFAERRTVHERPSLREDTVETVRYARKDHRVLALLAVKFGWGVAGGVLVLLPILALGSVPRGRDRARPADGGARGRGADRPVPRKVPRRPAGPAAVRRDRRRARHVRGRVRAPRPGARARVRDGRGPDRARGRRRPVDAVVVRAPARRARPDPRDGSSPSTACWSR